MSNDIRPFGAGDGPGYYWIRGESSFGGTGLELVAIDELGKVTPTGISREHDPAAMTRAEAVIAHLGRAAAEADAALARHRADKPEPEPKPPEMDPATRRFFQDDP